jgi:hypothetical protein
MPAEKQKRKRKDAKASIEAKSTLVADAPNTTKGAKVFLTNNTGIIPKVKSSTPSRQKLSKTGPGSSCVGRGPGGH